MERIALAQFVPEQLAAGHKGWLQIVLWEDEQGQLATPAVYIKGQSAGPTVVIVAGVHGDEFEGMEAIQQLAAELEPAQLCGTVIGIPVVNPLAYASQTRETPVSLDGLNLARQFPGKSTGSVTEQLAYHWSNWIRHVLEPDDVFVDLHSAGTRYEYLSLVAFHETGDQTEQVSRSLAQSFGWSRLWRIPDQADTRVTFNGSIARCGIPTIATELRGRGGCLPEDVAELTAGLRRLLIHKRLLASSEPGSIRRQHVNVDATEEIIWSTVWLFIHTDGLFHPDVDLQQRVEAGQHLGTIRALTGESAEEIYAPRGGDIWGIRRFTSVKSGDYVFLLAFALSSEHKGGLI